MEQRRPLLSRDRNFMAGKATKAARGGREPERTQERRRDGMGDGRDNVVDSQCSEQRGAEWGRAEQAALIMPFSRMPTTSTPFARSVRVARPCSHHCE